MSSLTLPGTGRCPGRTPLDLGFIDVNEVIWLLKLGDPVVRCNALESLGQLGRGGDVRAVRPVASCLKDKKASVRRAAMQALRAIADGGDAVALEAAREAVRRCDCKLRRAALEVLGVADRPLALLGLGLSGVGRQRRTRPTPLGVALAATVAAAVGTAVVLVCLRFGRGRR
uniref:HEAT repeat domain-containing protein n=1 Tax=Alexandrium monilatum TaxID=311494 RepID=A0A7S4SXX2_9DINO